MGGGPGVDPEYAGGLLYPFWLGNALESPRRSWRVLVGRGMSGFSIDFFFKDIKELRGRKLL